MLFKFMKRALMQMETMIARYLHVPQAHELKFFIKDKNPIYKFRKKYIILIIIYLYVPLRGYVHGLFTNLEVRRD